MAQDTKIESPGAALVRLRWEKATAEDRAEAIRKMVAGRRRKSRKNRKGGAK